MAVPLISKTEANARATAYRNTLGDRVYAFLIARADAGLVGGAFPYTDQDGIANATNVRDALIAAGWTVSVDTGNKIVTIS
jgi:hypothetical protein